MTRNLFLVFLFSMLALIPGVVAGQSGWTLDRCIRYAWENNITVRNESLEVGIRKADYRQARNNLLPNLNFNAALDENFGRSIDPSTNTFIATQYFNSGFSLSSSMDLFAGFMKQNTLGMQKFNYLAEKSRLQQMKNELAIAVIESYFNVLLQNGLAAIAEENYQLSHDQLQGMIRFVEVGRKPGADLLETEANVAADSSLLVQSRHLLKQAVLSLKANMNFPVADTLSIDTTGSPLFSVHLDTLTLNNLYLTASETLPDLELSRRRMLAARKAVQVSKGSFSPGLSLYGSWGSQYSETGRDAFDRRLPFSDQISNNSSEFVSLNLSIPLFTRFSNVTALGKSKLQYEQAKNQYEEAGYKLKMVAEQSLEDWRAALADYRSSLHRLSKSYSAYQAAEKKLEKGLISVIEFDIQKNKWSTAKSESLRTGLQVMLRERHLRFLMTGSLINDL